MSEGDPSGHACSWGIITEVRGRTGTRKATRKEKKTESSKREREK